MVLPSRCLQAIAQHCVSLKSLYLEDCAHITDEGVVALQNCKHLRSLSLADNRNISSGCIAKLLQTISFKRLLLRKLDLRNSAVIALESASESLQVLDLSYNNRYATHPYASRITAHARFYSNLASDIAQRIESPIQPSRQSRKQAHRCVRCNSVIVR